MVPTSVDWLLHGNEFIKMSEFSFSFFSSEILFLMCTVTDKES